MRNRPRTMTALELAAFGRQRQRLQGWTAYEASLGATELPPLAQESYQHAVDNYEVWREYAIKEFDER